MLNFYKQYRVTLTFLVKYNKKAFTDTQLFTSPLLNSIPNLSCYFFSDKLFQACLNQILSNISTTPAMSLQQSD